LPLRKVRVKKKQPASQISREEWAKNGKKKKEVEERGKLGGERLQQGRVKPTGGKAESDKANVAD